MQSTCLLSTAATKSRRCRGLYQSGGLDVLLDRAWKRDHRNVTWVLEQTPRSTYLVSALQYGVSEFGVSLLQPIREVDAGNACGSQAKSFSIILNYIRRNFEYSPAPIMTTS